MHLPPEHTRHTLPQMDRCMFVCELNPQTHPERKPFFTNRGCGVFILSYTQQYAEHDVLISRYSISFCDTFHTFCVQLGFLSLPGAWDMLLYDIKEDRTNTHTHWTCMFFRPWNHSMWRKPTEKLGEHATSTQKFQPGCPSLVLLASQWQCLPRFQGIHVKRHEFWKFNDFKICLISNKLNWSDCVFMLR